MTGLSHMYTLVALTLLLGFSSLTSLGVGFEPLDPQLTKVRIGMVAGSIIAFLPFFPRALNAVRVSKNGVYLIAAWCGFALTCFLSSLFVRYGTKSVMVALWYLVGIPVFFFFLLPAILGKTVNIVTVIALCLGHLPYIVGSLIVYPDVHFQYKGTFGHPNLFGMTAALLCTCCVIAIVERVRTRSFSFLWQAMLLLGLGVTVFFVVLSGSRTSLLAIFLTCASAGFHFVKYASPPEYRRTAIVTALLFLLGTSSLVPELNVIEKMWQKHTLNFSRGDALSGRAGIWGKIADDMSILGNGIDYFEQEVGITSHNTFLRFVGERGPIAAALLAWFAVLSVLHGFRHSIRPGEGERYSSAPFFIAVCFWSLSLGEGMIGSLGNGWAFGFYLSVGVVVRGDAKDRERSSITQK